MIQEDMVVAVVLLPPLRESGQLELLAGNVDDGPLVSRRACRGHWPTGGRAAWTAVGLL